MIKKKLFLFLICIFYSVTSAEGMKRPNEDESSSPNKTQKTGYNKLGCKITITFAPESSESTCDLLSHSVQTQILQAHSQKRLKLNFDQISDLVEFLPHRESIAQKPYNTIPPDYTRYGTAIVNYLKYDTPHQKFVIKLLHLEGEGEEEHKGCMNAKELISKIPEVLKIPKMLGSGKPQEVASNDDVLEEVHKNTPTNVIKNLIKDPFIILFENASGEDIYTVLNNKKDIQNKKDIEKAFIAIADYLGKLHTRSIKSLEKNNPLCNHSMTQSRCFVVTDAEKDENMKNFEIQVEEKARSFTERKNQLKLASAIAHNDCHSGNVFYVGSPNSQPSYNDITLIDYADMGETCDFSQDIGRFIASLWQWYALTYTEKHITENFFASFGEITYWQNIIASQYIKSFKEKSEKIEYEDINILQDINYYKYNRIRGIINHPKNVAQREMINNLLFICLADMGVTPEFNRYEESIKINSLESRESQQPKDDKKEDEFITYSNTSAVKLKDAIIPSTGKQKPTDEHVTLLLNAAINSEKLATHEFQDFENMSFFDGSSEAQHPKDDKKVDFHSNFNKEEKKFEEEKSSKAGIMHFIATIGSKFFFPEKKDEPIEASKNSITIETKNQEAHLLSLLKRQDDTMIQSHSVDSVEEESAIVWAPLPMQITSEKEKIIKPVVLISQSAANTDFDLKARTITQMRDQSLEEKIKAKYAKSAAWNLFSPLINETENGDFKIILHEAQDKLNKAINSVGQEFMDFKNAYLACLLKIKGYNKDIDTHTEHIEENSYEAFYNSIFIFKVKLLKQYHGTGSECQNCKQKGILIKKALGERIGECWVCGFEDYEI